MTFHKLFGSQARRLADSHFRTTLLTRFNVVINEIIVVAPIFSWGKLYLVIYGKRWYIIYIIKTIVEEEN